MPDKKGQEKDPEKKSETEAIEEPIKEPDTGKEPSDIEEDSGKETPQKSSLSKTILILIVIVLAITIFLAFKQAYENNSLESMCTEIQNSEYLEYDCTCIPLTDDENAEKDAVEQQTTALCRCSCDIGADEPYIVDIRAAEE